MCHKENFNAVQEAIKIAAAEVNRKPREISLVAVSKTQPIDKIEKLISLGQKVFGENKVQEAKIKWGPLKSKYNKLELHLIGALQTNKVKDAVSIFDVIETIDRPKLAVALAKEMTKQATHLPCYIQVNTGEEKQKAGIYPSETGDFVDYCRNDLALNIVGLMCIPPANDTPALHFSLLATIAERMNLESLSMGMSSDYGTAIKLGATHIRLGTALFGKRAL